MDKIKYKGIYAYKDSTTNKIVYIGKDSHLYRKGRHSDHHCKTQYNRQKINRILQSNRGRYEYMEIIKLPPDTPTEELDGFEIRYINLYSPKFNFTIGGDGAATCTGRKLSEETKKKMSKSHKGKQLSQQTKGKLSKIFKGEGSWNYGKHHSEETKKKISNALTGKKRSMEVKIKLSKDRNSSGYYRVHKVKDSRLKQGFTWNYQWRENGKKMKIASVNLLKLESKVKSRGLPWIKLSEITD